MAGQGTGPCAQCEHYRTGASVARAAYLVILPAYQPKLRQSQTFNIQQESQAQAAFVQERQVEPQYADVQWLSRPTHPSFGYCGLDEFDGRYYKCEVKNADQDCPHFTPRAAGAAPRPCGSCRYHRKPLDHPVRVLEETFRRYGRRSEATLEDEIRSVVQMQAEGEYQDCVDSAGFLPKLPAFLPVCMARSSPEPTTGELRCLVGPVVNSAGRCGEWSPGAGASADADSAQLDALVAHVRGIVSQSEAATLMAPWQVEDQYRLQANAEAAIVARCLSMLGASPDHIAAVCNSFTQVFGQPWNQQLSAQIEASVPRVAPSPSQVLQTRPPQVGTALGGSGGQPGALGTQPAQMSADAAYEAGNACEDKGDMKGAMRLWRQAAEQGHWLAAYWLAYAYRNGKNPDPAEALRWWRVSAASPDNPNPAGTLEAIAEYEKELRAEEKELRAKEKAAHKLDQLLSDAASRGDWEAIYKAGMKRYESKKQEKRDEGKKCFQLAANNGHVPSMNALARMLSKEGKGKKSERWHREAAEQGDGDSASRLVYLLAGRGDIQEAERWFEVVAEKCDEDEVLEARKKIDKAAARETMNFGLELIERGESDNGLGFVRQAAELGYNPAQYKLALLLLKQGNAEEGERWLQRAAEGHDPDIFPKAKVRLQELKLDRASEPGAPTPNQAFAAGLELEESRPQRPGRLRRRQGDTAAADNWYRIAAEQGHLGAEQARATSHGPWRNERGGTVVRTRRAARPRRGVQQALFVDEAARRVVRGDKQAGLGHRRHSTRVCSSQKGTLGGKTDAAPAWVWYVYASS